MRADQSCSSHAQAMLTSAHICSRLLKVSSGRLRTALAAECPRRGLLLRPKYVKGLRRHIWVNCSALNCLFYLTCYHSFWNLILLNILSRIKSWHYFKAVKSLYFACIILIIRDKGLIYLRNYYNIFRLVRNNGAGR